MIPSETPIQKRIDRCRIVHQHDLFKGWIGYIVERIDQHSLCTYVIVFRHFNGFSERRAYQRNEIKFLKSVKRPKGL